MNEPLDPPADYSPSGPEQETIDLSAQLDKVVAENERMHELLVEAHLHLTKYRHVLANRDSRLEDDDEVSSLVADIDEVIKHKTK